MSDEADDTIRSLMARLGLEGHPFAAVCAHCKRPFLAGHVCAAIPAAGRRPRSACGRCKALREELDRTTDQRNDLATAALAHLGIGSRGDLPDLLTLIEQMGLRP